MSDLSQTAKELMEAASQAARAAESAVVVVQNNQNAIRDLAEGNCARISKHSFDVYTLDNSEINEADV